MAFVTLIIVDLHAIIVERGLMATAIFETMQVYLYACAMQEPEFMERIDDTSVIYRIGHIQTHDM
jgi:hypothetical protein